MVAWNDRKTLWTTSRNTQKKRAEFCYIRFGQSSLSYYAKCSRKIRWCYRHKILYTPFEIHELVFFYALHGSCSIVIPIFFFNTSQKVQLGARGNDLGLVVFSEIRNVWNLVREIAIQKVAEIWLTFSAGEGGIARVS